MDEFPELHVLLLFECSYIGHTNKADADNRTRSKEGKGKGQGTHNRKLTNPKDQ